jgi:hypothetical protein
LRQSNIDIADFSSIMGLLLHKREYPRDVSTPILCGKPSTGMSLLASLYKELIRKENIDYLSASNNFAYQDLVNKTLGNFEDIK